MWCVTVTSSDEVARSLHDTSSPSISQLFLPLELALHRPTGRRARVDTPRDDDSHDRANPSLIGASEVASESREKKNVERALHASRKRSHLARELARLRLRVAMCVARACERVALRVAREGDRSVGARFGTKTSSRVFAVRTR